MYHLTSIVDLYLTPPHPPLIIRKIPIKRRKISKIAITLSILTIGHSIYLNTTGGYPMWKCYSVGFEPFINMDNPIYFPYRLFTYLANRNSFVHVRICSQPPPLY